MRIANQSIELVEIDSIRPHPANPREGDVGAVAESIDEHGFFGVCVCQVSTRYILAGNHRWKAAKAIGAAEVPVAWVDCDDDEALRILLADNRTSDLASYDMQQLADLLDQLDQTERGLSGTGYDGDALDEILNDLERHRTRNQRTSSDDETDRGDELRKKWEVEDGQLWNAGGHRVICGDVLSGDTLTRLMADAKADVVLTDPPYAIYGSSTGLGSDITDDKIIRPFFRDVLSLAQQHTPRFASAYIFCDWRSWPSWWDVAKQTLMTPKNLLVWDKGGGGMGNNWANSHELIGYFVHMPRQKVMSSDRESGMRPVLSSNILRFPRASGEDRQHNAAKPVPILKHIIDLACDDGASVLDPFLGSGSTLLAAQETGRIGYGAEIDPRYVATSLERLASYGLAVERLE